MTIESRPGEPGYSDRGQAGPVRVGASTDRGNTGSSPTDNPFVEEEEVTTDDDQEFESVEERVDSDPLNWVDVVAGEVVSSLQNWGEDHGYSSAMMGQIYNKHAPRMFQELTDHFLRSDLGGPGGTNPGYYTGTPGGLNSMSQWAINWFSGTTGMPLGQSTGSGSGRRGSGSRGPTAQDIRNKFDINELTNGVNDMHRQMLFEDHPNAKALATEYVDAVVATRGEKKMDFATFVEDRLKESSRYKAIYRNKPEHLAWSEYMAPYIGQARQVARPDDADDIAIGGAQFGASPQAFQQRLMREDSVTGSAPFIQGLESRMRGLNNVFKGS